MADFLTKSERSKLMSRIKGMNTTPERIVASILHRTGLRFRRHDPSVTGKPDFTFRKARCALFIDGEFWHGKDYEQWRGKLSPFWRNKIEANIHRDRQTDRELEAAGWKVFRIWGRDVLRDPGQALKPIVQFLASAYGHDPEVLVNKMLQIVQPTASSRARQRERRRRA